MQLPTQQQFVTDCLSKYRWEPLPADQKWEAAHYPLPDCLGGLETVMLWSADHTVQGLLQSMEFDHPCFHHNANGKDLYNLETYYPQYLELFQQLKSQFSSRKGKDAVINKTGIHGRSAEQMTADAKKGGKIGGKKAAITNKANGTGAFYDPKIKSVNCKKGAATTNAQKWQCLVTCYISTPCGLSNYQKARGIDTKLRVKLTKQEVDDLERKS